MGMSTEEDTPKAENSWGWGWTNKWTAVAKEKLAEATVATKSYAEATKTLIQTISQEGEEDFSGVRLPWQLPEELKDEEEIVKKQIMLLSEEKWTFLSPPQDERLEAYKETYQFDADLAQAMLKADPKLDRMRFLLVPYKIKEDPFCERRSGREENTESGLLLVRPPRVVASGSHPYLPPSSSSTPPVTRKEKQQEPKQAPLPPPPDLEEEEAKSREQELEDELKAMGEDFQLDIDDLDLDDFEADLDDEGVIVD